MIQPTAFGILFACLLAVTLWLRPRWLAGLLPLAAVMQAPAVLVVALGAARHGITPFNTMAAVCGAVLLLRWARAPGRVGTTLTAAGRSMWPFFLLYSVAAALSLPLLFEGVAVQPLLAEGDVNPLMPEPNVLSVSHLAQAVNGLGLLVILLYLFSEPDVEGQQRVLAGGFGAALAATVLLGAYQRGAMLGWYPLASTFWGSNPTYNQWFLLHDYGPFRAALPFIEPSYASVWFAAAAAGAFTLAVYGPRRLLLLALASMAAALLGLANTVGTSGFAALAVFGVLFLLHFLGYGRRHAAPQGVWVVAAASLAVAAACAALLADWLWLRTAALEPVRAALEFTLSKTRDFTNNVRYQADVRAFEIFIETRGLGAGPGSTRASSYVMALLANAGLAGVLLFALALARSLARSWRLALRHQPWACLAAGGALAALAGVSLAISDQNWPVLWSVLFFAAVCTRALSAAAIPPATAAPPPPA